MLWEGPYNPKGWGGPAVEQVQGGGQISIPSALGPHASFSPAWQDMERFQARSQELEQKLLSKEQELEQLIQKQQQVCLCRGLGAPGSSLHPPPALAHLPCYSLKDLGLFVCF